MAAPQPTRSQAPSIQAASKSHRRCMNAQSIAHCHDASTFVGGRDVSPFGDSARSQVVHPLDEITEKHLKRSRIRGAPSTIPGSTGMVPTYDLREVQRAMVRALCLELDQNFTVAELRQGQSKLAQTAAIQELTVLEPALIALYADPMENVPHEWRWELLLPVRGRARVDEAAGIK